MFSLEIDKTKEQLELGYRGYKCSCNKHVQNHVSETMLDLGNTPMKTAWVLISRNLSIF